MLSATKVRLGGVMPLAVAVTATVFGAVAVVIWLASSGPPLPPPVTVKIPSAASPATPQAPAAPADTAAAAAYPDPALLETTPNGQLPVVDRAGRMAWQVYAMPFDAADKHPRIAIVVDDLGSSATLTNQAIQTLPAAVSLSFMPFRRDLPALTSAAHGAGHEILLDLPMEPQDAQHHDPGPNALRSALDAQTNIGRLDWMMGRASGYVGLAAFLGGRFATDRNDLQPILREIGRRGLLYVDNHAAPQSVAPPIAAEIGLPIAVASVQLDTEPSRASVDQQLSQLELAAAHDGQAVGIAAVSAAVIDRVTAWASTLKAKNLVLAPISAVVTVTKPPPPASPARPQF
jgi:polysaccharide deacetylase 2 family uncharacterized protein YibQ